MNFSLRPCPEVSYALNGDAGSEIGTLRVLYEEHTANGFGEHNPIPATFDESTEGKVYIILYGNGGKAVFLTLNPDGTFETTAMEQEDDLGDGS